ncbi:MAG: hypothetical protein ACMXYB_05465 [Candidatus Woesearchaeota archaeon]
MGLFNFLSGKDNSPESNAQYFQSKQDLTVSRYLNALHERISAALMMLRTSPGIDAKTLNEENSQIRTYIEQSKVHLIRLGVKDARYLSLPLIVSTDSNVKKSLAENINGLSHLNDQISLIINDLQENSKRVYSESIIKEKQSTANDNKESDFNKKAA